MGENAGVWKVPLFLSIELAIIVMVGLAFFEGPAQRWYLRKFDQFERARAASGIRRATPLLNEMLLLPQRLQDRVGGYGLTPVYVVRWWRARPLARPMKVLGFLLFIYILGQLDDIADWQHLRLSADPGPKPGVVQALLSGLIAVPSSMRNGDAIEKFVHLLAFTLFLYAEVRFFKHSNLTSNGGSMTYAPYDLEILDGYPEKKSPQKEYRRCWPVVALLTIAAQCAAVLRRWEETQPDCQVPRVSIEPVEQVIWKAHRTRRARARRHNERQLKAHAALVVGALRRAEARQDSEPGRALEDLTVMLLTIAERYAEGRVNDLLDDDQLTDVTPAAPRERLRMFVVGGVVVLVMAGAASLGLPDAALVPLLPLVAVAVAIIFNRSRVPSAGHLTDLLIPR
ncbi:hypothetical protein PUR49_11620 [Streptomyces sp. BE147]|uniref:hypothetical protein n=1 Tax=Streptomyces sp. BE147 TaxID=3002524 RepID=UPI002E79AEDA|nr:hypothetical protein [Streptomyces sp. BE147]MEE1737140.1 hypothetical protein [Streptomyces sp. BE147]